LSEPAVIFEDKLSIPAHVHDLERYHSLVVDAELGAVFSDRTRITSPGANLSVEPDVVLVLWQTLEAGRVREVPAASGMPGRYVELEGAADLVVEILSDSSGHKDTRRLPPLYATAGVRELWLVDARGEQVSVDCRSLTNHGTYRGVVHDPEGWFVSAVLDRAFRLVRHPVRAPRWRYSLEHRRAS
jgi:Uma2 family endonuclease